MIPAEMAIQSRVPRNPLPAVSVASAACARLPAPADASGSGTGQRSTVNGGVGVRVTEAEVGSRKPEVDAQPRRASRADWW